MYVYVCICMYMYVYVCNCMYVCMYVCMCVYMYAYMYYYHKQCNSEPRVTVTKHEIDSF